jgi:hypothetical protein
MTVACPGCSRTLNVPDDLLGELVKCPVCSKQFKVEPEVHAPSIHPADTPTMPYTPRPEHDSVRGEEARDQDAPSWHGAGPGVRRDLEPHRGTLVLVFGILSICVPCVSLILGPIAWIMGSSDLRAMRLGRMDPSGEGSTKAGYICGIVGTVLHLVGLLGCCGLRSSFRLH